MTRAMTGGAAIGKFAATAFQSVTTSACAPDDAIRKAAPAALSNESFSFGMSMSLSPWLYATYCCLKEASSRPAWNHLNATKAKNGRRARKNGDETVRRAGLRHTAGSGARDFPKNVDFAYSDRVRALQAKLERFMQAHVYPNERRFREEVEANRAKGNAWVPTLLVEELKPKARAEGDRKSVV